jgi:transcriptional regulator with GAF, ATPase, and Fis domain
VKFAFEPHSILTDAAANQVRNGLALDREEFLKPGNRVVARLQRVDLTSFGSHHDQAVLEYLTEADMRRRERENLFAVLQKAAWKIKGVNGAAELLGVKPTTLIARIEKMGLKRPA